MLHAMKRAVLAVALLATSVGAAATAEARDRYGRRGGGDDAAIAIGAGVVGLAIGAALASNNRRGYYRERYYPRSRYRTSYYYDSYPSYYYDSYPRYYRNSPRYRGDRYRSRHYDGQGYGYRGNGYRYHDDYSRSSRDYRRYRHGGW